MKRTHPMHDRIRRWLNAIFDWHRPRAARFDPTGRWHDIDGKPTPEQIAEVKRHWEARFNSPDNIWLRAESPTNSELAEQRRLRQMG